MKNRRSHWRETLFLFRELVAALLPRLGLAKTLERWSAIVRALAEPPRQRERWEGLR